jgi:hypothetical protein
MNNKKIVLVTTDHWTQWKDYSPHGEFLNIALYLVKAYAPEVILEEWREDESQKTIAAQIADKTKVTGGWHNISPSPSLNLSWSNHFRNLDGLRLTEYGPVNLQTAREQHMLNRVQEAMVGAQTGLVIAGSAHHHSLAEKLTASGFCVDSFALAGPSDALPDFLSSDWKWVDPTEFYSSVSSASSPGS